MNDLEKLIINWLNTDPADRFRSEPTIALFMVRNYALGHINEAVEIVAGGASEVETLSLYRDYLIQLNKVVSVAPEWIWIIEGQLKFFIVRFFIHSVRGFEFFYLPFFKELAKEKRIQDDPALMGFLASIQGLDFLNIMKEAEHEQ